MIEMCNMSNEVKGPVFLTIHKEGVGNPWSVLLINEGLQKYGCATMVAESSEEYEPLPDGVEVVPLFDLQFGLNRFSPVKKEASGVPTWAKIYSTRFCLAVNQRCIALPVVVEGSAWQIMKMFSGNFDPLGQAPAQRHDKKRRRAWRRPPQSRLFNSFLWHGGK